MTVTHRLAVAGAAALILFGGLTVRAQDSAVAKVDGKIITEADMRLAEAEIGSDLGSLPDATKRRVLLEFLIENQLFAEAAEKEKLAAGSGFDERMQYWRRRALRDAFFDKSIKSAVDDKETKRFYDEQVGALTREEEVRARHILVDSKDKAREIHQKILHGGDFAFGAHPGVEAQQVDELRPEPERLRQDRVVVARGREMAVVAAFGLGLALGVRVVRVHRLRAVARGRDRRLLHVDPLAVGVGGGEHQRGRGTHRRDLAALGRAAQAEHEDLVARHLRVVAGPVAESAALVAV